MGEDETVDFESLKQTLVILNMHDYPIPVDTKDDIDRIFDISLEALHIMGFRDGFMHLFLYSEQLNCDRKEDDMTYELKGESYTASVYKVPDIALYMIRFGSNVGPGPINFMVISKPKRELDRVLHCLKSRHHNVVLVEPDELCPLSVEYLLENARLLGGGKPRFRELYHRYMYDYDVCEEDYVESKEDVSKMVDFSERIPTVKGARTAVFWDAEDCPFPLCSTPDEIYHSVTSALVERDFSDKTTIWAYLDADKKGSWSNTFLGIKKTWASSIYFLPAGDKASRRVRMLNDIYLWVRDSPRWTRSYEAGLVLFADNFKDDAYYSNMLQKLNDRRYDFLLVTPTLDINKPESPEWPGLLIDEGASCFADETIQISEETREKLPGPAGLLLDVAGCPFGDETSKSSDDAEMRDSLLLESRTEDMNKADVAEEETTEKLAMLYRWDPITLMYKLKSLEWPGWQIDGGTGCESSEEPCPKKHEAHAAAEETPKKLPIMSDMDYNGLWESRTEDINI